MARTPVTFSKKDYYKSFKQKHPNILIEAEDFYNILDIGGKEIAKTIINDGEIKLASRLGEINVRKFKPHGKGYAPKIAVDKIKSRAQKKTVYQFNDHTDGWMYRFFWAKKKCKAVTDKNMWLFKPIRSIKRELARTLKAKEMDYPMKIND